MLGSYPRIRGGVFQRAADARVARRATTCSARSTRCSRGCPATRSTRSSSWTRPPTIRSRAALAYVHPAWMARVARARRAHAARGLAHAARAARARPARSGARAAPPAAREAAPSLLVLVGLRARPALGGLAARLDAVAQRPCALGAGTSRSSVRRRRPCSAGASSGAARAPARSTPCSARRRARSPRGCGGGLRAAAVARERLALVQRQHVDARAGAASGRRARGTPSPRPSARRAAARTDRGAPAPRAARPAPSRSTVCCALRDRRGRLERDAQHDRLAVADAALHAARAVRRGARAAVRRPARTGSLCSMPVMRVPAKPLPISKPFEAGSDSSARARSASSLSKTGSPSPAGTPRATHSTTPPSESPRARAASMRSAISAAAAGSGQRTGLRLDRRERHARGVDLRLDLVHALHPGEHLDARRDAQQLARDRAGGDAPDRLARARAPAALPVADAVLRLGRVVGVRGPVDVLHRLVGLGPRVLVAHEQRDRRAERPALEDAGEDLDAVGLVARRRERALAGPAPIEIALDLLAREREPRRAAVDHHADAAAVALAEGGDLELTSEAAAHTGG